MFYVYSALFKNLKFYTVNMVIFSIVDSGIKLPDLINISSNPNPSSFISLHHISEEELTSSKSLYITRYHLKSLDVTFKPEIKCSFK